MPDDDKTRAITIHDLRPGYPKDKTGGPNPPGQRALPKGYSKALHFAIVQRVRKGNNPATAAAAEGLMKPVFYQWQADYKEGVAHPSIVEFFENLDRAYNGAEADAVEVITDPEAAKSVENMKWLLEHARAKDWARQEQIVIRTAFDSVLGLLEEEFKEEPQLYERVLKVMAQGTK